MPFSSFRRGALLRTGAVATLLCLGAGCASDPSDGSGASGGFADPPEDVAPAAVQELVVGYREDPWVDSETDHKRFPSYPLNADVCETLVVLTPDFQVGPGLAQEWELIGDNTFEFSLRDDVTFSDGTPLTAEQVKYTLDYTTEEPDTSGFGFLGPESTEIVDEQTVTVTPTQPNLRLVEQINHPTYAVLAPGSDPLNDPDVTCTGPFTVSEYLPEEHLVVERNENYWAEPPMLDKITFRFIPDDTTRTLALQNGEVDLITGVPRNVVDNLEQVPGLKLVDAPTGQVLLMYVSQRDLAGSDRLLADPDLRRAVAMSMDREAFVEGVLGGNASVVDTVAPPAVLGDYADIVEGIDHDPEGAAQLLDEAGWMLGPDGIRTKDGRRLELDIVYARVDMTTVEFVQAQLMEVGIAGNILQLDPGAYSERLSNGDYDLDISLPSQNDANPAFLMSLRWYSKSSVENAQFISPGPDTRFEELIDETQRATDPDELQRLAAEAMHELVDVEVAGIPLAGTYNIFAMKEQVQGLEPHPSGTNQRWATVYIGE